MRFAVNIAMNPSILCHSVFHYVFHYFMNFTVYRFMCYPYNPNAHVCSTNHLAAAHLTTVI